jgi:hypothetical protein
MQKDTVAFIDLDGTISDQYLWQALFAHHLKKHFNRLMSLTIILF